MTHRPARLLSLLLVAATLAGPVRSQQAGFIDGVEDLPLMPGLAKVEGTQLVFDKPEGRIVEVTAAGSPSAAAVDRFYAETLPQLGWRADGAERFVRDREGLTIQAAAAAGRTTVRFRLAPLQ